MSSNGQYCSAPPPDCGAHPHAHCYVHFPRHTQPSEPVLVDGLFVSLGSWCICVAWRSWNWIGEQAEQVAQIRTRRYALHEYTSQKRGIHLRAGHIRVMSRDLLACGMSSTVRTSPRPLVRAPVRPLGPVSRPRLGASLAWPRIDVVLACSGAKWGMPPPSHGALLQPFASPTPLPRASGSRACRDSDSPHLDAEHRVRARTNPCHGAGSRRQRNTAEGAGARGSEASCGLAGWLGLLHPRLW